MCTAARTCRIPLIAVRTLLGVAWRRAAAVSLVLLDCSMVMATLASESLRAHVAARDLLYLENYKLARTSLMAAIQVRWASARARAGMCAEGARRP